MHMYRKNLPQIDGDLYLTDAGLETDLIFNKGIEIPEFAAHTLLRHGAGRMALRNYFKEFLDLARKQHTGFVLDAPTWKAHRHWGASLGESPERLEQSNREAIAFMDGLRQDYSGNTHPIVLNAPIGPKGDAYRPDSAVSFNEAVDYHAEQLGWLAATSVDMVTALTFTQSAEAAGVVKAASDLELPVVVSFTVETDGALPSGQPLDEAIRYVEWTTDSAAAYYMVNCAHPEHFEHVLTQGEWRERIRGIRCNASRCSHEELDACEVLDDGNPAELAADYQSLMQLLPWLNVIGGCCGSDIRHVTAIADCITNVTQGTGPEVSIIENESAPNKTHVE